MHIHNKTSVHTIHWINFLSLAIIKVLSHQYQWLAGGNRTFLELASMVVTLWIVTCLSSAFSYNECWFSEGTVLVIFSSCDSHNNVMGHKRNEAAWWKTYFKDIGKTYILPLLNLYVIVTEVWVKSQLDLSSSHVLASGILCPEVKAYYLCVTVLIASWCIKGT